MIELLFFPPHPPNPKLIPASPSINLIRLLGLVYSIQSDRKVLLVNAFARATVLSSLVIPDRS